MCDGIRTVLRPENVSMLNLTYQPFDRQVLRWEMVGATNVTRMEKDVDRRLIWGSLVCGSSLFF